MINKPLVSIIIATYNSSEYVLETLESALSQSYSNIEIIVTDDCSTDNTVNICSEWITSHQGMGRDLKIVTSENNTGVSGNANRGFAASRGEWIKFIAGDDILAPLAIEKYVEYIQMHQDVRHLRACAVHFSGPFSEADLDKHDRISNYMYRDEVTVEDQYRVITKTFFGSGPTYFIHADTFRSVGCFDERFHMQEDYPLFIKMIGRGYKLMYMDFVTVYKRVVASSIQYDKNDNDIFPKNKVRMIMDWKYQYKMEVLNPFWKLLLRYSLWIQQNIIKLGNSKMSLACKTLYFIYKVTDPFVWCDRWLAYKNKQYLSKYNTSLKI